jgi:hypothetical protein
VYFAIAFEKLENICLATVTWQNSATGTFERENAFFKVSSVSFWTRLDAKRFTLKDLIIKPCGVVSRSKARDAATIELDYVTAARSLHNTLTLYMK